MLVQAQGVDDGVVVALLCTTLHRRGIYEVNTQVNYSKHRHGSGG